MSDQIVVTVHLKKGKDVHVRGSEVTRESPYLRIKKGNDVVAEFLESEVAGWDKVDEDDYGPSIA